MQMLKLACARTACAILVLTLAWPAAADDIAGKYAVEGQEANSGASYSGEAMVQNAGDTYHVVWQIGEQVAIGTGILTEEGFAVTYMMRGAQIPGIALYKVASDGTLSGQFTMLGADSVGEESWSPVAG